MLKSSQLMELGSLVKAPGTLSRRRFVMGAASAMMLASLPFTQSVLAASLRKGLTTLSGKVFDLSIDYQTVNFTGTDVRATVVNQSIPGPLLRWKEGESVTLRVKNNLDVSSSIHWHGIILPANMDGVPGISFEGIEPGETFEYNFTVGQSGTYWYHSHSGFQEQTGMYGAIVIDPKDADPVAYDREYVVMLSDWSDEEPESIYAKLKKQSDYYNFRERTLVDLFDDISANGLVNTWNARSMWNKGRMSDRDISDVTGYTYTYLMNGNTPEKGWQGLFRKGERVRLRFINSAAMTIFDVRIPGLKMTVVASDGQNIQPVSVDEFRIGVAETYDVIVEPEVDNAYCIFAQSIDRTGFTYGSLTSDQALKPLIPPMDPVAVLVHRDMGMNMEGMDHSAMQMDTTGNGDKTMDMKGMDHSAMQMDMAGNGDKTMNMEGMDHSAMQMDMAGNGDKTMNMEGMDHSAMQMDMNKASVTGLGLAGYGSNNEIKHISSEFGPQVDMRAASPRSGLTDPGIGLRDHQSLYKRKVLTYADIKGLTPTLDKRQPSREIQLHLTGNMSRYMWSVNGIKFADAAPLELEFGERVRITLVNDTMMTHPMHLHGMWSELETGDPDFIPRKHTVIVQPGSSISYLVTADALGGWAYHCHLLFHMPGMFRKVQVKNA
ncbi:copper resistance system multicopper oxidase [Shewanella psychropiezotolerans]|uniref:Copper resistance system multicopper oxidase n=2 Tax=Shewanellaceae TaxID=267890 RepID=A0ABX5X6Z3_9GAMM|nr:MULTISPECIES: copper resistance system multicopper oxidase [Shewanella]MPY24177.1 copper resistance system multicopper oxidase [Shewanella sp. YLB-07]QDO86703.1 copper resistance system multicopper oxidase [Shewanella psychropiezotolerans]